MSTTIYDCRLRAVGVRPRRSGIRGYSIMKSKKNKEDVSKYSNKRLNLEIYAARKIKIDPQNTKEQQVRADKEYAALMKEYKDRKIETTSSVAKSTPKKQPSKEALMEKLDKTLAMYRTTMNEAEKLSKKGDLKGKYAKLKDAERLEKEWKTTLSEYSKRISVVKPDSKKSTVKPSAARVNPVAKKVVEKKPVSKPTPVHKKPTPKKTVTKPVKQNPFNGADDVYLTKNRIAIRYDSTSFDKKGNMLYETKTKYLPKTAENLRLAKESQDDQLRNGR